MANDVGIRIGVDGERQFRSAISAINAQARALSSEMRAVTQAFTGMEDSEESVAAQTDVLNRAIATQRQRLELLANQSRTAEQRLEQLGHELDVATRQFGSNSREAARAQNAYNNQVRTVQELNRQMNDGRADLARYERELENIGRSVDDVSDEMREAGREATRFGDMLKAAIGGGIISGAIQSITSSISGLVDESIEYNRIMASLEISSEKAGYALDDTYDSFYQLQGILGDEQTAATTVANLQALGLEQEELTRLTDAAIGAWATYGDSIPIDGLAEAINETIRVGQVTGTFADVLNWAGTSEDDFNLLLEGTKTEAERVQLVMDELNKQQLPEAAQAWRDANSGLVEYQEANARLTSAMADIGTIFMPYIAEVKNSMADLLMTISYGIKNLRDGTMENMVPIIEGYANSFVQGITTKIPLIAATAKKMIEGLISGIKNNLPQMITTGGNVLAELVDGMIQNLPQITSGAAKIITELARAILADLPAIATTGINIIKSLIGGIFKSIPTLLQAASDIIIDVAEVMVHEIPVRIGEVATALIQGFWQGIKDGAGWIKDNIKSWCGDLVGVFKNALGIHSPSKVMQDSVGKPIVQGVSAGMKNATPSLLSTADKINQQVLYRMQMLEAKYTQVGKDAVDGMAEGMQAAEPTALAIAQELNDRLIAKQEELTEALKADNLTDATKASLNAQLTAVKEFQSEYQASLDDIVKSQESMASRLQEYGDLFTRVTDENSEKELINVEDLQAQINKLNEFDNVLVQLEKREIPAGLLDQIAAMDVDDAVDYGTELLKMSDAQFDSYALLWEKKQATAAKIAEKYYQDELTTLKNDYLDKIPEAMTDAKEVIAGLGAELGKAVTTSVAKGTDKAMTNLATIDSDDDTKEDVFNNTVAGLTEHQYILTDYVKKLMQECITTIRGFLGDFRTVGMELMDGLSQGILDGRSGVIESIRRTLEDIVEQARRSLQINSPSKVFEEIGDYTAQGFGVGFADRMAQVSRDVAAAMPVSIGANRMMNSGGSMSSTDNRSYRGGDIVLNIERVDNGNGRDIQQLATELQFYIGQQNAAVGGGWA